MSTTVSTRPQVVNIGAIFSFKSVIGKAAKVAIEAAVEDINSSPDILQGTKLRLNMTDSNYSGFMAIVEGMYEFIHKFNLSYDMIYIYLPNANLDVMEKTHF